MKGYQKLPKVTVLRHGDEYISPDFAPICPECGCENCSVWRNCDEKSGGTLGKFGTTFEVREYYKEYVCAKCSCRFRIDEGYKVKVDWGAVIAILVCLLVVAFLIICAVLGAEAVGE